MGTKIVCVSLISSEEYVSFVRELQVRQLHVQAIKSNSEAHRKQTHFLNPGQPSVKTLLLLSNITVPVQGEHATKTQGK